MAVTSLLLGAERTDESGMELTVRTFLRGAQMVVTICYNGAFFHFAQQTLCLVVDHLVWRSFAVTETLAGPESLCEQGVAQRK